MKRSYKHLLSVVFTGVMLAIVYRKVDFSTLRETFAQADATSLLIFFSLFIPQTFVAAWRWKALVARYAAKGLTWRESYMQVLGSYSANLMIPGKVGEMVRGMWLKLDGRPVLPFYLVFLEKVFDLLAVLVLLFVSLAWIWPAGDTDRQRFMLACLAGLAVFWLVFPLVMARSKWLWRQAGRVVAKGAGMAGREVNLAALTPEQPYMLPVGLLSVALWSIQMYQFYWMFRIFGSQTTLADAYAGGSMGLLAGIIPLSLGGIGFRDAALMWYFGPFFPAETVLSVGILSAVRVVLPALVGVPMFLSQMHGRVAYATKAE